MRNGDTIVMTQRRSSRWLRVDQILDVRHKRDRGLNPLSSTSHALVLTHFPAPMILADFSGSYRRPA